MTIDARLLAGAIGITLALAACGGASTATKAPASAGAVVEAPTEQPMATGEPEATEAPEASEEPAATEAGGAIGALNDLADKLPEQAGGITFERGGYDGSQLGMFGAAAGLNGSELDPILKAKGKTLSDVNFAIASPTSTGATAMVMAIQIEGVPATEFGASMNADLSSMPKTTLGGKTVYGEAAGGMGFFAYPKDDTLFLVLLADEKVASSIIEQLP